MTPSTERGRNSNQTRLVRLIVTALAIALWFATQSLIGRRPALTSGIGDGMHLLLAPLNQLLHRHPSAANTLLIVSSGIIDLLAIFVLVQFIFHRSVRPLLGLLIVMGLRQIMQALCALPTPEDMIWHNPGFPSLLVTYDISNDYFFSGHTAVAVFAATELVRFKRVWLTALAVVTVVFEVVTVLTLRAHYTMDVFAAIAVALYVAYLAESLANRIDRHGRLLQTVRA